MIYGAIIDSTCVVLQQSCSRKGACLLYDHDSLRFRLHVLPFCAEMTTVFIKLLAWYVSRRQEKAANAVTGRPHNGTSASDKPAISGSER